jgi:uncharacterized protein (DUF1330 family)
MTFVLQETSLRIPPSENPRTWNQGVQQQSAACGKKRTVSAYFVFNYDITHPERFSEYAPAAQPSLRADGAKVLVADFDSEPQEGHPGRVTIILEFDSKEAAREWYQSPEYQSVRHLRTDNSQGISVICDTYVPKT